MRSDQLDAILQAGLAAFGLGALALAHARPALRRAAFALTLLAGVVAWPGVDRLRGRNLLHGGELFHYVLGAKYFPELGYDGLYDVATRTAFDAGMPLSLYVRNLRTSVLEENFTSLPRGAARQEEFRGTRLLELRQDLAALRAATGGDSYLGAVMDHGFNATPTWIGVARRVVGDAPLTTPRLHAFVAVDVALLGLLLLVVGLTFGLERAALTALVLGTGYVFRSAWIGGSLLRFDWLLALGLGMCALATRRDVVAGVCFAWAASLRLFPATFAVFAVVPLIAALRTSASARARLARLAAGGLLGVCLALAVGASAGRGPAAFREFAARYETHRTVWASNHIGVDALLTLDQIVTARAPDDAPNPFEIRRAPVQAALRDRRPVRSAITLVVALFVAYAIRREPPETAAAFGPVLALSMAALSGYYLVMVCLAGLTAPRRVVRALVAVTFVVAFVDLGLHAFTASHIVASVLYPAVYLAWAGSLLRARQAHEAPQAASAVC